MRQFAKAGSWTFEQDERLHDGHLVERTDGAGNVREDAVMEASCSRTEELAGDNTTSTRVKFLPVAREMHPGVVLPLVCLIHA